MGTDEDIAWDDKTFKMKGVFNYINEALDRVTVYNLEKSVPFRKSSKELLQRSFYFVGWLSLWISLLKLPFWRLESDIHFSQSCTVWLRKASFAESSTSLILKVLLFHVIYFCTCNHINSIGVYWQWKGGRWIISYHIHQQVTLVHRI